MWIQRKDINMGEYNVMLARASLKPRAFGRTTLQFLLLIPTFDEPWIKHFILIFLIFFLNQNQICFCICCYLGILFIWNGKSKQEKKRSKVKPVVGKNNILNDYSMVKKNYIAHTHTHIQTERKKDVEHFYLSV